MQSFRILDGQARYLVAAVTLLIATLITAIMPIVAGAAQVTERSVALSSSAPAATGVSYTIKFTAATSATDIVLDFCGGSPLIGDTCGALAGFSVGTGTISGFTKDVASDSNTYIGEGGTITAGANELVLSGITNPNATGSFYVRILTFAAGNADGYASAAPGTYVDDGAVAVAINNTIGVAAAVLESLTFCVSGQTLADGCIGSGAAAPALTAPTLRLGADQGGGVIALDDQAIYTGDVYTQISTNAGSGAVVSLKSSTTDCGGLLRAGTQPVADRCSIAPALLADFALGAGKFGVKTAASTGGAGAFQQGANYSNTEYRMNYVAGNATGVTSTYGDPFLNTNSAPATNRNMTLTFGATAAPGTPAGLYSADINLVATGTF